MMIATNLQRVGLLRPTHGSRRAFHSGIVLMSLRAVEYEVHGIGGRLTRPWSAARQGQGALIATAGEAAPALCRSEPRLSCSIISCPLCSPRGLVSRAHPGQGAAAGGGGLGDEHVAGDGEGRGAGAGRGCGGDEGALR